VCVSYGVTYMANTQCMSPVVLVSGPMFAMHVSV
jgi:hypothetical protein